MQLIWSCRPRRPAHSPRSARPGSEDRALLVVVIGGFLWLGVVRESGAEPRVTTRLVWDGSVCGSAEDFAARVGKRTNVARFVQRGQRLLVRARIERRGDGLSAHASIEARGRAPIVRHIESPDCEDALDALALVVAIGIEGQSPTPRPAPRARRRPSPSEPAASVQTPPEPPPADVGKVPTELPPPSEPAPSPEPIPAPPPAVSEAPAPEPTPAAPEPPAPAPPRPAVASDREVGSSTRPAPLPIEIGAGISAALSTGVAPTPLFGGGLWISAGWARESIWSPELVVSAQYQRLHGLTRVDGQADFALSVASLSLCPLRLGNAEFVLRPCASGAGGRLQAEGQSTFDARSWAGPWWAVGGTLEGLARAGIVEFRAVLGATAPLVRDSFQFRVACDAGSVCEADVFHHVEPVIWSGALGVGIRIW